MFSRANGWPWPPRSGHPGDAATAERAVQELVYAGEEEWRDARCIHLEFLLGLET